MSIVWEDINSCANQCMCALAIYLMTLLSSEYGIIMNLSIDAPGHGNICFDGINVIGKHYFKGRM